MRKIMTLISGLYKTNLNSLINLSQYFKSKHFNLIKKYKTILIPLKQSTLKYINISILVGYIIS